MGRISASLSGFELRLVNVLRDAEAATVVNMLRLATGKIINDPKDDPSGFVTLSRYEQQLANVQATSANVSAANTIVSQTQLTLDQVRTQLNTIRTKLLEDVGQILSASARTANQLEIDNALDAIADLAATQINGKRVLDGSADFQTSGKSSSQVAALRIFSLGAENQISGSVTQTATQATLTHDAGGLSILGAEQSRMVVLLQKIAGLI